MKFILSCLFLACLSITIAWVMSGHIITPLSLDPKDKGRMELSRQIHQAGVDYDFPRDTSWVVVLDGDTVQIVRDVDTPNRWGYDYSDWTIKYTDGSASVYDDNRPYFWQK